MTETSNVDGGAVTPSAEEQPTPKYTDQDLDKYKGSARKEGRQAALNELLGKVEGAGSVDDLVTAWQEKQQLETAAQSEAERIQQQLNKVQAERDQAMQLAQQRLVEAELRNQLIAAGVPAGSVQLQDAMRVVDTTSLEVGDDGTVGGVQEAIQGALEARPWLTADSQPQQQVYKAADTSQTARNASSDNPMASFLGNLLIEP